MNLRLLIALKLDSIVVIVTSILYGAQLIFYPHILQTYKVYTLIREMFDNKFIGAVFIVIGVLKLLGIVFDNQWLRRVSIRGLLFLWLIFMIAFLISPPPNTVWVTSFAMVILSTGVAFKEG